MHIKVTNQWRVIKRLAKIFKDNSVLYHYDASTSVFIHGVDFEMDDIDIVFPYNSIELIRALFSDFDLSDIKHAESIGLKHFKFYMDQEEIHCLFYEGAVEDFANEDVRLVVEDQEIWAKSLKFYARNTSKDNPLLPRVLELLEGELYASE